MNSFHSNLKLLLLIMGFRVRIWLNNTLAGMSIVNRSHKEMLSDRRSHAAGTSRVPIPRKRLKTGIILVFAAIGFLVYSVFLSTAFLSSLAIEHALQPITISNLEALEKTASQHRGGLLARREQLAYATYIISEDNFIASLAPEHREPVIAYLSQSWVTNSARGLDIEYINLPNANTIYPIQYERLVTFSSLGMLLALIGAITVSIGIIAKNIGDIDADTIWFISLPIPTPVLFAARIIENALLDSFFWVFIIPFLTICALVANHGWASPWLALATGIPLALALAGVRLALETLVRLRLTYNMSKNLQIVCSITGIIITYYLR